METRQPWVRHIIVGVDGSSASRPPLEWALLLARETGAEVTVLHAVGIPDTVPAGPAAAVEAGHNGLEQQATALLEHLVAECAAGGEVEIHERVVVNHGAARALVEGSASADLLVLGARGQGGHPDLTLGSVSRYCAHHSRCPVVIVPPEWQGPVP